MMTNEELADALDRDWGDPRIGNEISRRLRGQGEPKQVGFIYYEAATTGGSGYNTRPRFYTNPDVVIPSCHKGPFPVYTLDGEQGERIEVKIGDRAVTLILHPQEPEK